MKHLFNASSLLGLFFISALISANETIQQSEIVYDPFDMPVLKFIPEFESRVHKQAQQSTPSQLRLFSTYRAGKNSMANINGQIIKLGEKINDYKLIAVNERSVTLIANKKRSQITLDDTFEIK